MTIRSFFSILAVLSFLFGIGFVVAPGQVLVNYDIELSPALALVGRLFGGALLALGVVLWLARDFRDEAAVLGRRVDGLRTIEAFLPYDDVDPHALRGTILFDGSKMDVVWDLCRREGLEVVADVHTHPAGVGQSQTDRDNPMIPEVGHVALIVPNFADRAYFPGDIGIYEYRGRRQ